MILLLLLLTFVYIYIFSFLVSMIRFLFVLGNFLEDPSVNHSCDVGILLKLTHVIYRLAGQNLV